MGDVSLGAQGAMELSVNRLSLSARRSLGVTRSADSVKRKSR
jgi:hypothetical protein